MGYRDWSSGSWAEEHRHAEPEYDGTEYEESPEPDPPYARARHSGSPYAGPAHSAEPPYGGSDYSTAAAAYPADDEEPWPPPPRQRQAYEASGSWASRAPEAPGFDLRPLTGYTAPSYTPPERATPLWAYPEGDLDEDAPPPRSAVAYHGEDGDDAAASGYGSVLLATAGWFGVPLLLYTLWTLTLDANADPRCVDGVGDVCASDRSEALTGLADSLPRLGAALLLSLVIGLALRWTTSAWRAVTIGFAAAVIGAGLATIVFSVLSGEKIG